MSEIANIVNLNDLEWQEENYSEHYAGWSKRLSSAAMDRKQGHIGVRVDRLRPKTLSCPFHYHMHEDEFCLILKGEATLRYGDRTIEVEAGDAISFPRAEGIAHQFYNHTDEPVDILMVGENLPHEVCYYPDSDKWMIRSIAQVGKFSPTDYWTDEPDPPVIKSQG